MKKDFKQGLADCAKAIALKPDAAEAYRCRGNIYVEKKDLDKAVEDFSRAIALKADDAALYLDRGSAYRLQGDYGRAIADLSRSVALDPGAPRSYSRLGHCCYEAGKDQDAVDAFIKSLNLHRDPGAWAGLAMALLRQGHADKALSAFRKGVKLEPALAEGAKAVKGKDAYTKGQLKALDELAGLLKKAPRP